MADRFKPGDTVIVDGCIPAVSVATNKMIRAVAVTESPDSDIPETVVDLPSFTWIND